MAGVSLRGVKKSYDSKTDVIHGIDMEIADGEFIVIVGPSGCGKSTLLRMIAGLERITGGDIAIGQRVVNALEPKDRDIAMVFQNYALYPHMSVYDNMAYGLRIRGMSKVAIDQRVQQAAKILELSTFLQRKPRQLSGGQRQRVAMGRAIVREPAVFLFDEPLSNLDAKLRVQMRLEIKRLQRELGTTSVYVTHDQVEAMTLADRLIVMNAGRAEQIGTPMQVYETPASTFVAGFIGSPAMNFLSGKIAADRRSVELATADNQHVTLPLARAAEGEVGSAVTLGVRPEHLLANGGTGAIALQIEMVEPLGADTLLHGHFGESREGVTVRMPGHVQIKGGETRRFAVDAANVHLFDTANGQRISLT
ncbi:MAG TPA: sn-glycerol-3-phosphate import ATP-binding protein UgpC [Vineibacter sp.]|nr:sn-glycerol-3-phosphate import ATP-binding protein UgpC [Vineibacter sp.]